MYISRIIILICISIQIINTLQHIDALVVTHSTPLNSFCHSADFEYEMERIPAGYRIRFFDESTKDNAFIVWVNIHWSATVIDRNTPPNSMRRTVVIPAESKSHTVRLLKIRPDEYSTLLKPDEVITTIAADNTTPFLLTNYQKGEDMIRLKFWFEFWLVSEVGDKNAICQSPMYSY